MREGEDFVLLSKKKKKEKNGEAGYIQKLK